MPRSAEDTDPTLSAEADSAFVVTRSGSRAAEVGQTVSRYRILRRIGAGGLGEVFEAEDLRLGRKVALKFLHGWVAGDDRARVRFRREARAAAALDHSNICTVHDIDETDDGRLFIAMALCDGEALDHRIARGPLEVAAAVEIAREVARGLAKAHEAGIVHRDVKPANIVVTKDAGVKILDFGLARLAGRAEITRPGGIMGTASYMSPEQARGERVDPRTDVWSLGVVLYEMLTGAKPFRGDSAAARIHSIAYDDPVPATRLRPAVGRDLEGILERALAKPLDERYPQMTDLLHDLSSLGESSGDSAAPPAGTASWAPVFGEDGSTEVERPVFVARDEEQAQLDRYLDSALGGRGLVAFVIGGAGRGKTSLLNHFAERAQEAHPGLVVASGNCNAHTSIGDPYLPFSEVLAMLTGDVEARWAARAMTREQASRLWHLLPDAVEALLANGRGLIDSFVPGPALYTRAASRAAGSPGWLGELSRLVDRNAADREAALFQQSDLFEQYTRVLRRLARQRPLLILLDNLQWADAGSISLLFHLGKRLEGGRILIVGGYRPTEVALGRGGERHPLEPVLSELQREFGDLRVDLGRARARRFVEAFVDSEPNRLDRACRETLFRRTRGHALYTVELVREMQDRGALVRDGEGRWIEGPSLDWTAMPARVEAVVGERIARLPEGLRELLTVASVEGEDFTAEVVARSLGADDLETVRRLAGELDRRHRLVQPRGLRRSGGQRLSLFQFRHYLFQAYLYGSLAEPERVYLHDKVGTVLETLYGARPEEISVQLARHFEQAGLAEKAVRYLLQAGEKAVRQSAYEEAMAHLERGLELLSTLPAGGERDLRELDLLMALGPVVMAAEGWSVPETEKTYTRARELCERLDQSSRLFPALWGLWQFHSTAAELRRALEIAEELLALARRLEDPALLPAAYRALGETSFWLGKFEAARAYTEQGFGLYDPEKHGSHGYVYGLDPGVLCLIFSSWTLWCLGYPDQALERARQGEALASEVAHPFSLGLARFFVAICHQARGEVPEARKWAEATVVLAEKVGFSMLLEMAHQMHGWSLTEEGKPEDGVAETRQSFERWSGDVGQPWFVSLLVEGLIRAGDDAGARRVLAENLASLDGREVGMWDAELHRLEGILEADAAAAEACYARALEVARRQGAKSLELRAATHLARLLQGQGKRRPAQRILAEVYGAFSEGFTTRDLREAATLLESLA